jgi:glyoxylase-like metal-dependent hydrolase (beta-lactamase superfamily II)/predicted ester cyclase
VDATPAEIARAYFGALAAHDLDAAVAVWRPGAIDRIVGDRELVAPEGLREYFGGLFRAFPDFALTVKDVTSEDDRVAVRWHAHGTFAGPGELNGFAPNHGRIAVDGCDVCTVQDGLIVHNDAFSDSGDIARQLGLLPANGSPAQVRLAQVASLGILARRAIKAGEPEPVGDGVWVIRGGVPRTMNIYLIDDGEGVTVFDAGIDGMAPAILAAAASRGGVTRVVLGHADADHRGAAPRLGAPVFCHPAEREAAESPASLRDYFDLRKLRPYARPFYERMLPVWDGGAVQIAGTVSEDDEVAGFRVVELPGHAPGLIALYRETDGLALVSDAVYTLDPQTGRKGPPRLPHPAFDQDLDRTRAAVHRLADIGPRIVWAGHADPVTGDVVAQLRTAADAPSA